MLQRLNVEESESDMTDTDTIGTSVTSDSDGKPNAGESHQPAMSSVFPSAGPGDRSASPSRTSFSLPFRRRGSGSSDATSDSGKKKKEDAMSRWLRDGTVVYKSVGLGLMDLVVGMHIIKLAKEKDVGTQVGGF